ncbi:Calcium-binding protein -like protein [Wallemia ichthyophaga EXF-994]|uniref:Calcium-binding protein-like protein n=1 Tax=Wallemia ichthyophaga (strain EXF-994 / CBS 113033) TaxID=1299270 RepID=R9APE7_WALI9|nr:Calcium-binding protein -like protein [Wallemia ichthyophaga EXF-994]EOR04058.1 Calcium-binding protein -like protein [Wallemia ichthyophaga EXF-994]
MNFFKARPKTPGDIAKSLKDCLNKLDSNLDNRRRNPDDIGKLLQQMKHVLNGDGDSHPQPEAIAQLAQEVYALDLLQLLIKKIGKLEFEARKEVTTVFNCLLRRQIGLRYPTVEYILTKPQVLFLTLDGYNDEDVSLNTGMILREMLRHEALVKLLLYDEQHFYTFPKYIETTTFGVSCDAFSNFKECLTRHKALVAEYLELNYDRFFSNDPHQLSYNTLINSNNYVTKRQSLKLLGEILLDRSNFNVMTRYISYENNLKVMMNLLRDKSRNIQFEAFHVFKVFVANPKKAPTIAAILRRNREKLIVFLKEFHNDKDDEVFTDEKMFLIHNINEL